VQLIEDLLDISRVLRGKLSLTVVPVNLDMVILAALETLCLEAKSLQIQTTLSPTVGMISGDAGRLQQVVWNLLSNAVKFTPEGGQIVITLSRTGTSAQIQFTDTGKAFIPTSCLMSLNISGKRMEPRPANLRIRVRASDRAANCRTTRRHGSS